MNDYPFAAIAQGGEELTVEMVEAMAAWQFAWDDERNLVMLTGDDEP